MSHHAYRQRNASGHGTPMTDHTRTRLAEVAAERHTTTDTDTASAGQGASDE